MNKLKILKVKDETENHYIHKDIIFNIPFRVGCIAKSQSGKTNVVVNLLSRDEFYGKDFKPENIYIISPSAYTDGKLKKLIKYKDIDKSNIFTKYSPELLEALYENIKEEYEEREAENKKPEHVLIYMDDIGFDKEIKKSNIMSALFMNSRHYLVSIFINVQKYTSLIPAVRENCSGMLIFPCSFKQLESINDDINYSTLKKNEFIKIFRENTKKPYHFMVINFSNEIDNMYLDYEFKPIQELNNNIL